MRSVSEKMMLSNGPKNCGKCDVINKRYVFEKESNKNAHFTNFWL